MNKKRLGILCSSVLLLGLASTAQATLYDRGSGMIYDDVLDITWLQDANYAKTSGYDADGRMDWNAAMAWATGLSYGGYNDWRLPTIVDTGTSGCDFAYGGTDCGYNVQTGSVATTVYSELASLFYDTLGNNGWVDTSGNPTGCSGSDPWCLTNTGLFTNMQSNFYWSGTEYAPGTYRAWGFYTGSGVQDTNDKNVELYAWAVRSGDVGGGGGGTVPEPGTLLLMSAGLAGLLGRRR